MVMKKWIVAKESIPSEYEEAYKNLQRASSLVYNSYDRNNPSVPCPPPREVQRMPMPQEVSAAFSIADQTTQAILGSYDASLGINNNQLSGVAIVEGATQSNATAMPFVVGHLQALTQAAKEFMQQKVQEQQMQQQLQMQQMQQAQNQPNPLLEELKLEGHRIALKEKELHAENEIKAAKLALEKQAIDNKHLKAILDIQEKNKQTQLNIEKAKVDGMMRAADINLKNERIIKR